MRQQSLPLIFFVSVFVHASVIFVHLVLTIPCLLSLRISVSDSMNVSTNCKVEVKTETQEHIDFCSNDESSDQMEVWNFVLKKWVFKKKLIPWNK